MRDESEEQQLIRTPDLLGTCYVSVFRDAGNLAQRLREIFPYSDQREAFIAAHLWAQPGKLGANEMAVFIVLTACQWTVLEGGVGYTEGSAADSVKHTAPELYLRIVKRPGGVAGDTVAAFCVPKDVRALDIKTRFPDLNQPPPPLPNSQPLH